MSGGAHPGNLAYHTFDSQGKKSHHEGPRPREPPLAISDPGLNPGRTAAEIQEHGANQRSAPQTESKPGPPSIDRPPARFPCYFLESLARKPAGKTSLNDSQHVKNHAARNNAAKTRNSPAQPAHSPWINSSMARKKGRMPKNPIPTPKMMERTEPIRLRLCMINSCRNNTPDAMSNGATTILAIHPPPLVSRISGKQDAP